MNDLALGSLFEAIKSRGAGKRGFQIESEREREKYGRFTLSSYDTSLM